MDELQIVKTHNYELESPDTDIDTWVKEICENFEKRTDVDINELPEKKAILKSALGYRLSTHESGEDFGGSVFDDVIGIYTVKDSTTNQEYIIEISSDPAHILNRTTGRPGYSCEQIDQHYWLGPFHDIALRNATAYFYKVLPDSTPTNLKIQWIGRLNLRWCIDEAQEYNIGVDPNIYPMFRGDGRDDNLLETAIWDILSDAEYLDYRYALTPYIYRGHSDTTPSGNVKLPFKGLRYYL